MFVKLVGGGGNCGEVYFLVVCMRFKKDKNFF